jgi:hypothetical protein
MVTARRTGDGDILERIDAAVAELCACGCGRTLDPDGPSAYYATPECQRRWAGAHATDPDDVYTRPDAADVYAGADSYQVSLTGDHPPERAPAGEHRRATTLPPCPDPHGVAYRRVCRRCHNQASIPRAVEDADAGIDVAAFGRPERVRYHHPTYRLFCPLCGDELDGPAYLAHVREDADRLLLELRSNCARTTQMLTVRQLRAAVDRNGFVAATWRHMEHQLDAFHRGWCGRRELR